MSTLQPVQKHPVLFQSDFSASSLLCWHLLSCFCSVDFVICFYLHRNTRYPVQTIWKKTNRQNQASSFQGESQFCLFLAQIHTDESQQDPVQGAVWSEGTLRVMIPCSQMVVIWLMGKKLNTEWEQGLLLCSRPEHISCIPYMMNKYRNRCLWVLWIVTNR